MPMYDWMDGWMENVCVCVYICVCWMCWIRRYVYEERWFFFVLFCFVLFPFVSKKIRSWHGMAWHGCAKWGRLVCLAWHPSWMERGVFLFSFWCFGVLRFWEKGVVVFMHDRYPLIPLYPPVQKKGPCEFYLLCSALCVYMFIICIYSSMYIYREREVNFNFNLLKLIS